MEFDWSDLPIDALEAISKKITTIGDYLRFRTVCIAWRSALPPAPRHLPPQLPWFMLPYDPHSKEGNDASLRFFYDMSANQIRRINLPETCGKQYCGSSRGWLVLEDGPKILLLNPITRVQIQLPSLDVLPAILNASGFQSREIRSRPDVWPSRYGYKGAIDPIILRIILTSSPLDPGCIVMAIFKSNWGLAVCRIGDESWNLFEVPGQVDRLIDATYHNGLFYCVWYHEVRVYDRNGTICEVSKITVPFEEADYHLMEGEVEDLLLVAQPLAPPGTRDAVSIYKLGIDEEHQPNWIEVRGIGDRMCFICEDIEQCFIFPKDNLQMLGLGPNLLSYAYLLIVEKNPGYIWKWPLEDEFDYDINMVKLPLQEAPIFSNYWKNHALKLVSFGSYPTEYSLALWITPSFY